MIKATTVAELLKIGMSLLAAYVAFAAFAPKIIEKYEEVLEKALSKSGTKIETRDLLKRRFRDRFERPVKGAIFGISPFAIAYLLCGIAVVVLLGNLIFSDIPCGWATCHMWWLPMLAGVILLLSLLYLVAVALALLNLFVAAYTHSLRESIKDE